MVRTCQRLHLDFGSPGRRFGGAVAGPSGPPGAREAQRAGQGAQHRGADWLGSAETGVLRRRAGESKFRGGRGLAKGSTYGRREGCGGPRPRRPLGGVRKLSFWARSDFPRKRRQDVVSKPECIACAFFTCTLSSLVIGWSAPSDKVSSPRGSKVRVEIAANCQST